MNIRSLSSLAMALGAAVAGVGIKGLPLFNNGPMLGRGGSGQRGMKNIIGPTRSLGGKGPSRRDSHRESVALRREMARTTCPPGMRLERHLDDQRSAQP